MKLDDIQVHSTFQMNSDDLFIRYKAALYLKNVLKFFKKADEPAMELIFWIIEGKFSGRLIELVLSNLSVKDKDEMIKDFKIQGASPEGADGLDLLLEAVDRLGPGRLRRIFKGSISILDKFITSIKFDAKSQIETNLEFLRETFKISKQEAEISLFIFMVNVWKPFAEYFDAHLDCQSFSGKKFMASALGLDYWQFQKIINGQLCDLGLIKQDYYSFSLDENIIKTIMQGKSGNIYSNFFVKAEGEHVPLRYHLLPEETLDHVFNLLGEKRPTSTHILLYGPPGTGKTAFARGVSARINCPSYSISPQDDDSSHGLRLAIQACLNVTNTGEGSIMIVDEAESVLEVSRSFFDKGEVRDKGWLNQFLEKPGVRAIWITNHVDSIDESTKRRFSFSLQFKTFNRSKRIRLWNSILTHNKARHLLTPAQVKGLARQYDVSAGAITTAIQKSREIYKDKKDRDRFYHSVLLAMKAYETLTNNGDEPIDKSILQRDYSLDGLNIKKDIQPFIQRMKSLNQSMPEKDNQVGVNILFHGPPGTGKTELAKYIGQSLDREISIKYASDILGPYVGMNEKNIAKAFQTASENKSILVFEEVDSFLSSREMAHRSWEVNMVNEFLVRMENFKGILICTTNNYPWVDKAALRRFMFKVEFDYLSSDGKITFYDKLLSPLAKGRISQNLAAKIKMISNLTPGDFRVVRDKHSLFNESGISHSMLVASLEEEAKAKSSHNQNKKVGF